MRVGDRVVPWYAASDAVALQGGSAARGASEHGRLVNAAMAEAGVRSSTGQLGAWTSNP